jgi:hypothetical protein
MPYSITTKDGITINNIPDNVPADDASLKQRVASIRAGSGASAPAAPAPALMPNGQPVEATKAPTSGYFMGLRDPFDGAAQLLERALPDGVSTALNKSTNWLHDKLPSVFAQVEESPQGVSKLVQQINKDYDAGRKQRAQTVEGMVTGQQPDPGYDWGRLTGNVANPINLALPGGAVGGIGKVMIAGAKAGAMSGALQPVLDEDPANFWSTKAKQTALGAGSGALAAPLVNKIAQSVGSLGARAADAIKTRMAPAVTPQTVQQAVADALQSQGMRLEDAPPVILQSVARQAQEALAGGQKLDAAAALRKAQFEAVGMTGEAAPTLGQVTRDPMQYANERNLVGVRIQTPQGEGNPLSARFQNQSQAMQGVFDRAGATGATDAGTAGGTLMDALRGADAPVKGAVDEAYSAARAMNNGRAADLERGIFSQTANQALDQGMLGHALPADVRNLLNDISSGKTPFTVDAAVQIDTILSDAQRRVMGGAQPDRSAGMAIGKIREALHNTPLVGEQRAGAAPAGSVVDAVPTGAPQLGAPAVDRTLPAVGGQQGGAVGLPLAQPGAAAAGIADTGANARAAFDQARQAARNRFATIEQTPALAAALDNAAPDKFVQQYLLNAPARDVAAMRTVLQNSPEALQQARAQIAATLKRAAFGNNASGDAGMSAERYLNTLRALGPDRLRVFFTPEELVQFNLAGKVMSDITSIPAGARGAVNTSGTAGAVMNLLSRVAENPMLRKIPFGRSIANQVGEMQTERAMNQALSAKAVAAKPAAQLSPEAQRALRLLFAPAPVAAGALGGQAVQ